MDNTKVWVLKLKFPLSFYWLGNPKITELIIPADLEYTPMGIKVPLYGYIYWWQFERIEVWHEGKLIKEYTEFLSPHGDDLPCDI